MSKKSTFLLPPEAIDTLEILPARVRLDSGATIKKTELVVALIKLLQSAKINTKKVHSVSDIIAQLKVHIRRTK